MSSIQDKLALRSILEKGEKKKGSANNIQKL